MTVLWAIRILTCGERASPALILEQNHSEARQKPAIAA